EAGRPSSLLAWSNRIGSRSCAQRSIGDDSQGPQSGLNRSKLITFVSLFRIGRVSTWTLASFAAVVVVVVLVSGETGRAADALSVRLTSPLGRTGTPGAVRIVARIHTPSGAVPRSVRFLIDGSLYRTKDDGPPYVVEWVDENPFERREITVEV